ncbi:hypothetical protein [Winogradskyella ouciana]|uniref:WG containing repeat-containing protein n=1 Tax=Winogradskyella ouciana TaxID=2608631 RepID=A0A7K1GCC7_9FLAO|nr:hypothetical protein [Winogradskyella ouciana]MTE26074.1 hypothetical protein [Winogradskyella ouciana]
MMKAKYIITLLSCLLVGSISEAQLLKKLKKKAEQAVERTLLKKTDEIVSNKTEKAIDGIVNPPKVELKSDSTLTAKTSYPDGMTFENPAIDNNTETKRSWYTEDVRVTSYDKEKQSDAVSYFDADAVAMQSYFTDPQTGEAQTAFVDSDGFFVSYNETEGQYTKTALLTMPGMDMMAPSMMASAYKLPEGAIFEGMEEMKKQGLAVYPFMHVDFPFVLKPEHFRNEMIASRYRESVQSCRGKMGCTKFSVTDEGYEGTYTLFDNQNRLVEINIIVEGDPFYGSGKGKIEYFYEDCNVQVPKAVEKKMLGQDLLKKGLDPTNKN